MKKKCILCTAVTEEGPQFYDHLEDVHMMPIRRKVIGSNEKVHEETHTECMQRFKFNHTEYGTQSCWCPDCIGGETLTTVNEICAKHGQIYVKGEHSNK